MALRAPAASVLRRGQGLPSRLSPNGHRGFSHPAGSGSSRVFCSSAPRITPRSS